MIEVTFEYVKNNPLNEYQIKLDSDLKIHYYRPAKTIYVVRHWVNDSDYIENEFETLQDAKRFALKHYDVFDINKYKDVSFRYWCKQYQYENKELIGVEEQ